MTCFNGITPSYVTPVTAAPAATDAADSSAVVGGGAPTQGSGCCTSYDAPSGTKGASDEPNYIPAPTKQVSDEQPPAPIDAPGAEPLPTTPAPTGTTAASRPTWPTWVSEFSKLGLSADEIAAIGATDLSDAELGSVYADTRDGLTGGSKTPGQNGPGQTTWDAEWETRFRNMGLPAAFIAELHEQAVATGADDAKLQQVYADLVTNLNSVLQKGSKPGSEPPVGKPAPTTPGQKPVDPAPANGWTPDVAAKFAAIGMPESVQQAYASAGLSAAAFDRLYEYVAPRFERLEESGYGDKLRAYGANDEYIWPILVGKGDLDDKESLRKIYNAYVDVKTAEDIKKSDHPFWKTMSGLPAQIALNLFPGGRVWEYAHDTTTFTDKEINHKKPLEIFGAGLSGLALAAIGVAALRTHNTVSYGRTALTKGLPEVGKFSNDAAMAITTGLASGKSLKAYIPLTESRGAALRAGSLERASMRYHAQGQAALKRGGDETVQSNLFQSAVENIAANPAKFTSTKSGLFPKFMKFQERGFSERHDLDIWKRTTPVTFDQASQTYKVHHTLGSKNGADELAAFIEAEGYRVGYDPSRIHSINPKLEAALADLSPEDRVAFAQTAAGDASRDLAAAGFGTRPLGLGTGTSGLNVWRHLRDLRKQEHTEIYDEVAKAAGFRLPATSATQAATQGHAFIASPTLNDLWNSAAARARAIHGQMSDETVTATADSFAKLKVLLFTFADRERGGAATSADIQRARAEFDRAVTALDKIDTNVRQTVFGDFADNAANTTGRVATS